MSFFTVSFAKLDQPQWQWQPPVCSTVSCQRFFVTRHLLTPSTIIIPVRNVARAHQQFTLAGDGIGGGAGLLVIQQNRLGHSHHALADRHRGRVPGRAFTA